LLAAIEHVRGQHANALAYARRAAIRLRGHTTPAFEKRLERYRQAALSGK
jgi:hypothetical protein